MLNPVPGHPVQIMNIDPRGGACGLYYYTDVVRPNPVQSGHLENLMHSNLSRFASIVMLAALMAGCASAPPSSGRLRSVALVMSGDVVSYNSHGSGTTISIVDVDGKPVAEPYGPVELKPGRHAVTLKCDSSTRTHVLTVSAGEVYQFAKASSPGVKGCTGSLSRVRSANP